MYSTIKKLKSTKKAFSVQGKLAQKGDVFALTKVKPFSISFKIKNKKQKKNKLHIFFYLSTKQKPFIINSHNITNWVKKKRQNQKLLISNPDCIYKYISFPPFPTVT
jgi:hypothetical protein